MQLVSDVELFELIWTTLFLLMQNSDLYAELATRAAVAARQPPALSIPIPSAHQGAYAHHSRRRRTGS